MKTSQFHNIIRKILQEEVENRSSTDQTVFTRVPEVTHGEDYKKIVPHEKDSKSKEEILDDITKVVKSLNIGGTVVWDDHDDISISLRDLFRIRVIPKWENNYSIEAITRNEDRIFITGQNLEQVKEFIKINLKSSNTNTDRAYNKTVSARTDKTPEPDKGLPQKDKPKIYPLTNEPPKETQNKEKNFTKKDVENEKDLQEKPMASVKEFKRQGEFKTSNPSKLQKEKTKFPKKPDTKLIIKQK